MFKNRLFVLLAFLAVSCGVQASQMLKIETKIERVGMIQYLPINMLITLVNEGSEPILLPEKLTAEGPDYFFDNLRFEVQGNQDLRCLRITTAFRIGPNKLFSIPSGGKYTFQREIAAVAGLLNPGTYQVRVVWDSRQAHKGWQGYAESEWVAITIEEAKGPDMGLINAAKAAFPKANWQCLLLDGSIPMELLSKYPTSLYMGNRLVSGGHGYREGTLRNIQGQIDYFNNPKRNPAYLGDQPKVSRSRVEAVSKFLAEHPDFFLADWMRLEILYWEAHDGKFDSARAMSSLIEKTNSDKDSIALAKDLIACLKKAGMLKD